MRWVEISSLPTDGDAVEICCVVSDPLPQLQKKKDGGCGLLCADGSSRLCKAGGGDAHHWGEHLGVFSNVFPSPEWSRGKGSCFSANCGKCLDVGQLCVFCLFIVFSYFFRHRMVPDNLSVVGGHFGRNSDVHHGGHLLQFDVDFRQQITIFGSRQFSAQ